ncbi:DUF6434 domain-containing protein [Pseudomonas sp. GV071]|jgi:hypothetical protein|uniref:DUF6434 domain-containing protein n=1 Tax=Pseudomonas sp. GV071 TaxID=2135754 RepID=UPI000D3D17EB|nr:DUF6434 domain-containing protein [Pseudomonas sp. GV071]PTQ70048.1 hypothetical protein C8K61_107264 [Pseudomonas sp. GV071]
MPFDWHADPITAHTPLDKNYRSTQNVRRFLAEQCRADVKLTRDFMAWIRSGEPQTMGDVAAEWTRRHGQG